MYVCYLCSTLDGGQCSRKKKKKNWKGKPEVPGWSRNDKSQFRMDCPGKIAGK